jgi:cobalt-zinc-cadmium resistance protein CzcA
MLVYQQQNIAVASARVSLEKTKWLPEFSVGYNHQYLFKGFNPADINRSYFPGTRIAGVELGMSLPLFTKPYRARIEAEKLNVAIAQQDLNRVQWQLTSEYQSAFQQYLKHKERVDYYQSEGIKVADEQIRIARFAFSKGEISYVEMVQNLTQAMQIKLQYLQALQQLNEAVINIKYLKGQE